MTRYCSSCGCRFSPKGSWQKACWPCWRREHPEKQKQPPRVVVHELVVKIQDETLIRDCVRLVHPDLHPPERFELANRTTAALLELLAQTRAARKPAA